MVIVYDITNRESFEAVDKWMKDARDLRDVDQALIVMAGNKADMGEHGRQVSTEEAEAFAKEKEIMFFEISALSGQNVQMLFNEVAKKLTGIQTDIVT